MDLQIKLESSILNIRVALILETPSGIIFENRDEDYYFLIGGKIKLHESSLDAIKRELNEELKLELSDSDLKLKGIIENLFNHSSTETRFHEICFYYKAVLKEEIKLPHGYFKFEPLEAEKLDIRPVSVKKLISSKTDDVMHIINKE